MRDSGLLEHFAHWAEAVLEVEAFDRNLRMEIGEPGAALARRHDQVIEYLAPDSAAAVFGQDRHPANLGARRRFNHPAASDWLRAMHREHVDGAQVVHVALEGFVD